MPKVPGMCSLRTPQVSPKFPQGLPVTPGIFCAWRASWLRIVDTPPPVTRHVGKYPFFDTPLSVGYRRRCCIKKRITGNLIKLLNTICNPFVQPFMEMVGNRFMQP
jgi:hypothetical protein